MTGGASASGASNAFGIGPSSRYIHYSYLVFMVLCALSDMSWLYPFDHVVAFHMLYDLVGTLHMPCLHAFNHVLVNYMIIYDVTFLTLLFLYVIIFMLLLFLDKNDLKIA
jgi:cytochrome b subunit of formate dehydrogenase